jgi:hypothetical protein
MKPTIKTSRRDFILTGSLGAGALLLGSALSSLAAQEPDKKLGIALVGLGGYSSGQLAPALQHTKNCYLAGIVTGTPAKAEDWSKNTIFLKRIFITIKTLTR